MSNVCYNKYMDYKQKGIDLVIEIRRCCTCHGSEDLVNATFYIKGSTMRRYFICRPHKRAMNVRYYYKNKYKDNK